MVWLIGITGQPSLLPLYNVSHLINGGYTSNALPFRQSLHEIIASYMLMASVVDMFMFHCSRIIAVFESGSKPRITQRYDKHAEIN